MIREGVARQQERIKQWLGFIPTPSDWKGAKLDLRVHCFRVQYVRVGPGSVLEARRSEGASDYVFMASLKASDHAAKYDGAIVTRINRWLL